MSIPLRGDPDIDPLLAQEGAGEGGSRGRSHRDHSKRLIAQCSSLIALLLTAAIASAHVPPVAGKLVDCIRRSDVVVAGVVERVTDVDPRMVEATVRIERTLLGDAPGATVIFRGGARFASKQRYVVFLHRDGSTLTGVQPAGTYFPSAPADDTQYEQIIAAVRAALLEKEDLRVDRLRSALIPALRARPKELRYNAALELGALAHHGPLSIAHRREIAAIAAEPGIDPTLRRMIELVGGNQ